MTLTREGDFVGSEINNVEWIKFFEGQFNRITFEQVMDLNWDKLCIGVDKDKDKDKEICAGVHKDLPMHLPASTLPV